MYRPKLIASVDTSGGWGMVFPLGRAREAVAVIKDAAEKMTGWVKLALALSAAALAIAGFALLKAARA
jgi:hypothetical protein